MDSVLVSIKVFNQFGQIFNQFGLVKYWYQLKSEKLLWPKRKGKSFDSFGQKEREQTHIDRLIFPIIERISIFPIFFKHSLTVSVDEDPHHGFIGLYLFHCHRFYNYRNGFLDTVQFQYSHRGHTIRVTQSRPADPIAATYCRRLYRCNTR